MDELDDEVNALTRAVIDAAIKVHEELGPRLLESTYQECLAYELRARDYAVDEEVALPVVYGEVRLECGYRVDLSKTRSSWK